MFGQCPIVRGFGLQVESTEKSDEVTVFGRVDLINSQA